MKNFFFKFYFAKKKYLLSLLLIFKKYISAIPFHRNFFDLLSIKKKKKL